MMWKAAQQLVNSLAIQCIKHCLHLAEGVTVAGASSAAYSRFEPFDGLGLFPGSGQRLRSHKIPWSVIGIVFEKHVEFGQGRDGITLAHKFHGDSVTGEAVPGVQRQDFFQPTYLIHLVRVWPDSLALDP